MYVTVRCLDCRSNRPRLRHYSRPPRAVVLRIEGDPSVGGKRSSFDDGSRGNGGRAEDEEEEEEEEEEPGLTPFESPAR